MWMKNNLGVEKGREMVGNGVQFLPISILFVAPAERTIATATGSTVLYVQYLN